MPAPTRLGFHALVASSFAIVAAFCSAAEGQDQDGVPLPPRLRTILDRIDDPRLQLEVRRDMQRNEEKMLFGSFRVFENRAADAGHKITLEVLVMPATGDDPRPDPIVFIAGGPGQSSVGQFRVLRDSWMREKHDIFLVSQRGTGGSSRLTCDMPFSDDNLQGYLDGTWDVEAWRDCLDELELKADLRMYSTCLAADDMDDLRAALGYEQINLYAGSYGTRASLVYMRRYPQSVRTATLIGVAPIAFTNPLYHAWGAQQTIEMIFDECANDPSCREAFPNLAGEFLTVLDRLEREPADVMITHPATGERVKVTLSRSAFAGSLRFLMYGMGGNRQVPMLVHQAFEGNYEPFAQRSIDSNRALMNSLSMPMLLCVTCAEDLDRIDPASIERETADTFTGPGRVLAQLAICEFWPRSELPAHYGDPVRADVPTLLLSGTLDPVTPPRWGAEAARHLPQGLHVVVPGAHGLGGPCVDSMISQLLESGSVDDIDTSCVESMRLPPFALPE